MAERMKNEKQMERYGLHSPTLKQTSFSIFSCPIYSLASLCRSVYNIAITTSYNTSIVPDTMQVTTAVPKQLSYKQRVARDQNEIENDKHFEVFQVMPGSCGKSVGEELFHTINNLDEDMNLVFIVSSSHFCSEYFNDALQCKTRKSYFFLLYGYPDCIQYSVFLDSKICQKKKKKKYTCHLSS